MHAAPSVKPAALSWEEQRDEILTSSESVSNRAERLLALLPRLTGEEQEEAAEHTANLLSDAHFAAAGAYLTNADAPEAVQDLFLSDLLNRPAHVQIPFYLAIARQEGHRFAAKARDRLALFFTEDHGTNWTAWEAAVAAKLRAHP